MKSFIIYIFTSLILLSSVSSDKLNADQVTGVWLTQDRTGKILIYKEHGKYFGKVVWMKNPNFADGKPKTDRYNLDKSLRNRPMLGLVILRDFVYKPDDDQYQDGYVYNPQGGREYDALITLKDKGNTLILRGYIGMPYFGHSQVWTRVK